MNDSEKALDGLEVGRRRIAREKATVARSLASLYERLGEDDPDVAAVDEVVSAWHASLIGTADRLSEIARLEQSPRPK